MKAFVGLVAAVLLAIGVGVGVETTVTNSASAAVSTAFQRAAAQSSEHIDVAEVITIPGSASENVDVSGDVGIANGSARALLTVTIAGETVDERLTPDGVFVNYGDLLALPNSATWLEISSEGMSRILGVSDATSLFSGPSADPSQLLNLLSAASTNGVTQVGTTTLDGTAVTEYQALVNLETAAAHNGAAYVQLLKSLRRYLTSSDLDVSVWIDAQGLPRQLEYNATEDVTIAGRTVNPTVQVTLDLSQFGVGVDVSDPPSGSVYVVPDSRLRSIASLLGGS